MVSSCRGGAGFCVGRPCVHPVACLPAVSAWAQPAVSTWSRAAWCDAFMAWWVADFDLIADAGAHALLGKAVASR
jgi:hypothetical protein